MPTTRQGDAFEPPPSSILATHVVHGNGVPEFDRDNFDQLLAEALGSDEQGQPNLGADVTVNHKLICIVYQIGIERALEENPFRAAGKADDQLRTCLEVLQVAVQRSPQVILVASDRESFGADTTSCPLYSWLIPTLLPLIASTQTVQVREGVLELFDSLVDADQKCTPASPSDAVLGFLRAITSGRSARAITFSQGLTVDSRNPVPHRITTATRTKESLDH